jgi:autotransporter passenger strand-loop-strand repeat protein
MATIIVSSGVTSTGNYVGYSTLMSVHGTLISATVETEGEIIVRPGGLVESTTINSKGVCRVSSGGSAIHAQVNKGGEFHISKDGTADFTEVNLRGRMSALSGAIVNNTTLFNGGAAYISSGASAIGNMVHENAMFYVYIGGFADQTTVLSDGGAHVTGAAINTTLQEGGRMTVTSNGSAYHTLVNSRAWLNCFHGGSIEQTSIYKGGSVFVYGTDRNTTVFSGGVLYVQDKGRAVGTTVSSGGLLSISSGGSAEQLKFRNGSALVQNTGILTSADVSSGGCVEVWGVASSAFVSSGGSMKLKVASGAAVGGMVIDLLIADGGEMTIEGGTLRRATVGSGGTAVVKYDVSATEVIVRGELQVMYSG